MVKLEKISKEELRPMVLKSYENDEELFNKYHVGKFSLQQCVEKTVEMIEEAELETPLNYYKVICNDDDIGYIVTFNSILYSFAIAMEYRKRDILIEWWKLVNDILGEEFYAILYKNNTRAIEFLKRQDMKIISENVGENYLVFSNN